MEPQTIAQPDDPAFAVVLGRMPGGHLRVRPQMFVKAVKRLENLQTKNVGRVDRRRKGIQQDRTRRRNKAQHAAVLGLDNGRCGERAHSGEKMTTSHGEVLLGSVLSVRVRSE